MSTNRNVQKQILFFRSKMGWTQSQLADRLGVSKQSVSNWETGQKTPRMGMIQNLSDLFNVPISQLLDGPDLSQVPAIETVTDIMSNLESSRQHNVLNYAQKQLDEQNAPTSDVHDYEEPELLAAHLENRNLNDEQQERVDDYIAKLLQEEKKE